MREHVSESGAAPASGPGGSPGPTLPRATEVAIVGAGLAGLACARRLQAAGVEVLVLEAADTVGGRVRTELIDGFRCDRGFQLFNPAYPEARRVLDVGDLRLQPFEAAVVVAHGRGRTLLVDPRRATPGQLAETASALLTGVVGGPVALAAFAGWALRAERSRPGELLLGEDCARGEALDRLRVRGRLRTRVVDPFLAGVLGEDDGSTSHRFTQLLIRSFVRGRPSLPWRGMQAIPDQLAAGVPVVTGVDADRVGSGRVETAGGSLEARAVVVATDPHGASRLLGLPAAPMRGLTTFWHVTDTAPSGSAALHLDGERRGPVINTVVMTNAAPGYSPDDRALVATTVLGTHDDAGTERAVLDQLALVYGTPTGSWRLLRRHVIPHALTAVPPPLDPRRAVDLGDGRFVAGDHRDTSSIQGALVSGRRAAEAVLARLGAARPAVGADGAA